MKVWILIACLLSSLPSGLMANEKDRFDQKLKFWEQWLRGSLVDTSGEVRSKVNGGSYHERFSHGDATQFVRTIEEPKDGLFAELFNAKYQSNIVSRVKGKWLIKSFTPAATDYHKELTIFGSDYFHASYGMCIHYFLVEDVIQDIKTGKDTLEFDIAINADKYPSNNVYQQRPDRAIVKFGKEELPTDVRFHFTKTNLNFAMTAKYDSVDNVVRMTHYRDFMSFPKLDSNLAGFEYSERNYEKFVVSKSDPAIFRLPYYGLTEPELKEDSSLNYLVCICFSLLVFGVVYAFYRAKK